MDKEAQDQKILNKRGRNLKLLLAYEGCNYHGWQYQENAPTVQAVVETALRKLSGENVRVMASGRTDAGVHARGQVINFKTTSKLAPDVFVQGMNALLPPDIRVLHAEEVHPEFHARFSARRRTYQYFLTLKPRVLERRFCWECHYPLNLDLLYGLADKIMGDHDFGAFARKNAQAEHKRCLVYESAWREERGFHIYRVTANRFLHGMVRTLVGTMVDVARGRFSTPDFDRIMASRDRTQAAAAAPARGLILEEVEY